MARRFDLLIAWPHAAYRRLPDLGRPDLRAAYELGVDQRLGRQGSPAEYGRRLAALDLGDGDVRAAVQVGMRDEATVGPPVLLLDLVPALVHGLLAPPGPRGWRAALPIELAAALTLAVGRLEPRLRHHRTLAADEAAPMAWIPGSAMAQMGLSLAVDVIAWRRGTPQPRRAPATALGAALVRAVMRRRSWRLATR